MVGGQGEPDTVFRRSSYCGDSGSCVEIGEASTGRVIARHSADSGAALSFTREEWSAFVAGVKAGEFDIS